MTATTSDILHAKALDQVAHLLASYEAGRITAESFRVGVETIWACLGGVVETPEFTALMHDAHMEVRKLPEQPVLNGFMKGDHLTVVRRTGDQINLFKAKEVALTAGQRFPVDAEAIKYVGLIRDRLKDQGYLEL